MKKLLVLLGVIFCIGLVGCSSSDISEGNKEKEFKKAEFELVENEYRTNLSAPLGDNSYELTVLNKYTDDIIQTIEQFKSLENKEEYSQLAMFFLSDVGEVVDKDGNKNEEPKMYGWIRLTKEEIDNINIDYYKEDPLMLFNNYNYYTNLKK